MKKQTEDRIIVGIFWTAILAGVVWGVVWSYMEGLLVEYAYKGIAGLIAVAIFLLVSYFVGMAAFKLSPHVKGRYRKAKKNAFKMMERE